MFLGLISPAPLGRNNSLRGFVVVKKPGVGRIFPKRKVVLAEVITDDRPATRNGKRHPKWE